MAQVTSGSTPWDDAMKRMIGSRGHNGSGNGCKRNSSGTRAVSRFIYWRCRPCCCWATVPRSSSAKTTREGDETGEGRTAGDGYADPGTSCSPIRP